MSNFLTIFTILCTVCHLSYSANDTLIFVQTLSRHGGRSPITQYETSLYNESEWFQGFGHLTQIGRRQAKDLGMFLKERYVPLLFNHEYDSKELYVRSTDVDRVLLTSRLSMDAMFPTSGDVINPIPIHTVSAEEDPLLLMSGCTAWEKRVNEEYIKKEMRKMSEDYEQLVTGLNHYLRKLDSYRDVTNVADGLICTKANNFTLPAWVTEDLYTRLVAYYNAYFEVAFNRDDNARLLSGYFLGHLISNIDKKISDPAFQWKGLFHYAHDTTLSPLLAALKVFNGKQPPFTSTIIIELYQQQHQQPATDDDYYVKILYRNDTAKPPVPLELPGCKVECPLKTFKSLTKANVVDDWKKVCKIKEEKKIVLRDILLLVTSSLLIVCVIIIIIMGVMCCRRNAALHRYITVPTDIE